jgi:hypothetical protein
MWSDYVSLHLLPRVHGFELLMAAYTVAYMKLGLQLEEYGMVTARKKNSCPMA